MANRYLNNLNKNDIVSCRGRKYIVLGKSNNNKAIVLGTLANDGQFIINAGGPSSSLKNSDYKCEKLGAIDLPTTLKINVINKFNQNVSFESATATCYVEYYDLHDSDKYVCDDYLYGKSSSVDETNKVINEKVLLRTFCGFMKSDIFSNIIVDGVDYGSISFSYPSNNDLLKLSSDKHLLSVGVTASGCESNHGIFDADEYKNGVYQSFVYRYRPSRICSGAVNSSYELSGEGHHYGGSKVIKSKYLWTILAKSDKIKYDDVTMEIEDSVLPTIKNLVITPKLQVNKVSTITWSESYDTAGPHKPYEAYEVYASINDAPFNIISQPRENKFEFYPVDGNLNVKFKIRGRTSDGYYGKYFESQKYPIEQFDFTRAYLKVNNQWVRGNIYAIKQSGKWNKVITVYINKNGVWKERKL